MKTVLVTGGTTRLGRAIADFLRAAGWRVLTTSHRAASGADIIADLSRPDEVEACFDATVRLLGGMPPDALVNNAALFSGEDAVLRALNLDAPRRLTERMAVRAGGRGAVVNILDTRVLGAAVPSGAYAESKAALLVATRDDARTFAATLRVNAVAPGPVLVPTEIHERAGSTPLGRPTPEDVARAVSFLLGASATTGAVIPVDGGQFLT